LAGAAAAEGDFAGAWRGTFRPVTKGQSTQTVTLEYDVAPDLSVTGHIGGARLAHAKLARHAWVYRNLLGHKTEYNIQGELEGSILPEGDKGWNRVYIHLRSAAGSTTAPVCSPIVSRNWGKNDMMPMRVVTFGRAAQPPRQP
jgi:hypothetical protein